MRLYQKTPKSNTNTLQEKSRISAMKATQLFRLVRGLGDSWSNSIRAAADTK
ncbi:pyruvate kinase [Gardnerella vaginalis]|nr:pyruvate kinase [Gardnerella vaginalis]RIY20274.1 pyruvate kinase [Gardnerella vaginalis]